MRVITRDERILTTQFHIVDRVTVSQIPTAAAVLDLWCPIIPDSAYQRVLDLIVESAYPFSLGHDVDCGNLIFHARVDRPLPDEVRLQLRYHVERRAVPHELDADRAPASSDRQLFWQCLRPERYVDVTDRTRDLARQIVGTETRAVEQARRIYDHVTEYMTYDATRQSWKGSTEHALTCTMGNCNDIHALFLSLCRSIGIPSRLVMGQALEPPAPGQEHCEICGYHCWAEFFAPGCGWVPVDASCACKYGKHQLFGDLEMNHIAWSRGRDILLQPMQRGDRLLYFAGPCAEVDGSVHRAVARQITFVER